MRAVRHTQSKLIGRVLRQCLANGSESRTLQDLTELARLGQLHGLVEAAKYHRVSNHIYLQWRGSEGVQRRVADMLAPVYEHTVIDHLRIMAELAALSGILDREGVPWLAVKGPVLAESVYPRFELRSYSDLDVVIQPTAFADAIALLENNGYQLLDRNWLLLTSELKGELHLLSPLGVLVDAHWDLINDSRVRRAFRVRCQDLLESARRAEIGDLMIPVNGPSEDLVYLATHACLAGGERLIWLRDIQEASKRPEIDWNRVVELAEDWGVAPLVAVMLDRSHRILSGPLSRDEIRSVAGGRYWLRMIRLVDRLGPPETIRAEGSASRIVARATRSDPLRSTIELARRSISWLLTRLGLRRRLGEDEARLRGSAFVSSGDWRDRQAFFQMTASAASRD